MQGPTIVNEILQQCRALGLDPSNLLKKVGLDVVTEVGLSKDDAASVPGTAIARTGDGQKD